MWDNNTPLQLLKTMPKKLNQDNLAKIQLVIDADKYKNSLVSGFDLCGIYAPFCRGCDKTSIYPCAIAYIRMLQSEGMNIQIDAAPMGGVEPEPFEAPVNIPKSQPVVSVSAPYRATLNIPKTQPVFSAEPYQAPVNVPKPQPAVSEPRVVRPKVKMERRPYESRYQPPVSEVVSEVVVTKHEPEPKNGVKPEPEPVISVPVVEEPVKYEAPVEKTVVKEEPVENVVIETPVIEPVEVKIEEPIVVEEPVLQSEEPSEPVKKKLRIAVARRKL